VKGVLKGIMILHFRSIALRMRLRNPAGSKPSLLGC